MLARWWLTFDAEGDWLAGGIEDGSCVAHGERLRLDEVGIEVVEGDDAAAGKACDHAQRLLNGLPVQVHCHTFPQEEARLVRLETCVHQFLQPVLLQEVGRHERDAGRVQADFFQHGTFCLLCLLPIDLEAADVFRHLIGARVPARAEKNELLDVPEMTGQGSVEEGRAGCRLIWH